MKCAYKVYPLIRRQSKTQNSLRNISKWFEEGRAENLALQCKLWRWKKKISAQINILTFTLKYFNIHRLIFFYLLIYFLNSTRNDEI